MNRGTRSIRRLAPVAVLALGAGAAVAQAAGSPATTTPRPAHPVDVRPAAPMPYVSTPGTAAMVVPAAPPGGPGAGAILSVTRAPMPIAPCRPRDRKPAPRTPPSAALLKAFGILRRDRTDADALPARALAALKARGLAPVDPQSARLLRVSGAAHAWVVPVPDVNASAPIGCARSVHAVREGLAVVALGQAPAGGGGTLTDLERGQAAASVDQCAGAHRDMLGVSGIVPDGVDAVFVTAPDGTATRADVQDNGYAFVLPRASGLEQRYLVWSGSDGTPHVQPLAVGGGVVVATARRDLRYRACAVSGTAPRVTPDAWSSACGSLSSVLSQIQTRSQLLARNRVLARARARVRRAPRAVTHGHAASRPKVTYRRPAIVTVLPAPPPIGALVPASPFVPCVGGPTTAYVTPMPPRVPAGPAPAPRVMATTMQPVPPTASPRGSATEQAPRVTVTTTPATPRPVPPIVRAPTPLPRPAERPPRTP
jgi:hypothetical protein